MLLKDDVSISKGRYLRRPVSKVTELSYYGALEV